jgi:hypothetical protein
MKRILGWLMVLMLAAFEVWGLPKIKPLPEKDADDGSDDKGGSA